MMYKRIDAHQHFWKYDSVKHAWIDESMHKIKRDFLPDVLLRLLQSNQFSGCVAVQAEQTELETKFLLALAQQYDFIKGVVGWVDLLDKRIAERLECFSTEKKLKGFRHVVQVEAEGFMGKEDFRRGIAALKEFGYTYDILIYHHQLHDAISLVNQFPGQPFVLNHIAKPNIKSSTIAKWKAGIKELAQAENVLCKVSGMVTEAHWHSWKADDFNPCLDAVFENFSPERIMFGSDWPVCNVAASYSGVVKIVENYIAQLSQKDQELVWFKNAQAFYSLDV